MMRPSCLLRLLILIIGLPLLILLVLAAVAVGTWVVTPAANPQGYEEFLNEPAAGYLRVNLAQGPLGVREMAIRIGDSLLLVQAEQSLWRSPAWVQRLVSAAIRRYGRTIVAQAIPDQAFELFYRVTPKPVAGESLHHDGLRSVLAFPSRLPIPLLSVGRTIAQTAGLLGSRPSLTITVGGQNYSVHRVGGRLMVAHQGWLVVADSVLELRYALLGNGDRERFRRLRSGLSDSTDLLCILDNANSVLRRLLIQWEPSLSVSVRPSDRKLVAYLFQRAAQLSDGVRGVGAGIRVASDVEIEGTVWFQAASEAKAAELINFLTLLQRATAQELNRRQLKLTAEFSQYYSRVNGRLRLRCAHGWDARFLKDRFRF